MSEKPWVVAKDGRQIGESMSNSGVAALVEENAGAEILVWREGMAEWSDPRAVDEIAEVLAERIETDPGAGAVLSTSSGTDVKRIAEDGPGATAAVSADLIRSFLDFRFETFLTPRLIGVLYVASLVAVALGGIALFVTSAAAIVTGLRISSWSVAFVGAFQLVLAPVFTAIAAAAVRVLFEVVKVLFKIKDGVETLAEPE